MRCPESKIKAAIQHPEEEVRLTALRYFTDSLTVDESIMPLVIQVGYCPIVVTKDLAIAKTLLRPGMRNTPEHATVIQQQSPEIAVRWKVKSVK